MPHFPRANLADLALLAALPPLIALEFAPTLHEQAKADRAYQEHETPGDPNTLSEPADDARWHYGTGGGRRVPRHRGAE